MITFEKFKELIGKFQECGMHARVGYEITESQFEAIAITSIQHIHKFGWDAYLHHMNIWRMGIRDNDDGLDVATTLTNDGFEHSISTNGAKITESKRYK